MYEIIQERIIKNIFEKIGQIVKSSINLPNLILVSERSIVLFKKP